jgi:GWxTD domain-containing protein
MFATAFADGAAAQRRFGPPVIDDTAVASTASRVYELEQKVKRSPNDATRWHELGLLAWALEPAALSGGLPLEKPYRLARVADSALQTAAMIAPRNVDYQLRAAHHLMGSKVALSRAGARKYFLRGVEAARTSDDKTLLAAAALEYGRTVWWHFEATEHRHMFVGSVVGGVNPRSLSDGMQPLARAAQTLQELGRELLASEMLGIHDPRELNPAMVDRALQNVGMVEMQFAVLPKNTFSSVRELLNGAAQPLPKDLAGWTDYEEASRLFQEAYRANPSYPGAFHGIAMAYAARSLWANLEQAARTHIRTFPKDSLAWLALGLARYRGGNIAGARRAFDSALVLVGPAERRRLDDWRRVVPPGREILRLSSGKAIDEDLYWKLASPLWSDSTHDTRLEFLSRVTYAELRWTVEEFSFPGADTDRGNVYVRYGPPDKVYGFGAAFSDDAMDVVQFWLYDNGLMFAFSGMPTMGTMRIPTEDRGMVDELTRLFPVRWDNISAPQMDSLMRTVSRFRAGPDSLDLAIAVNYMSPDSITKTMSIAGKVQRHLWIVNAAAGADQHSSAELAAGGAYLWRQRAIPGTMLYRLEAFGESATRGQRATGIIDATTPEFPLTGFGLSDLLIARSIDQPANATQRWRDVSLTPLVGAIKSGEPLSVVWENYELGSRDARAEYDVSLTLKAEKGIGARIRATIVGALAAVARTDVAPDQVTFTFSRSVPHAAAFADWITVNIPDAPSGKYALTLVVTDKVSGKTMTRGSEVVIR